MLGEFDIWDCEETESSGRILEVTISMHSGGGTGTLSLIEPSLTSRLRIEKGTTCLETPQHTKGEIASSHP